MARRFRKIDPRMWKDEGIRALPPDGKLIAVYCITAQSNRAGIFNFSLALAAEDLGIPHETFGEGFRGVCERLSWEWDEAARVLYLPSWWRYNLPENPNVLKSCLADLEDLPKTPLLQRFSRNLTYIPETFRQTFREGCGEPSPEPTPNQEKEKEKENSSSRAGKPPAGEGSGTRKRGAKKPAKPKPARGRDALFDAVAEVTASDPQASGAHVGKVVAQLRAAEPPYTPAEVRSLPAILQARGFTLPPTPGTVEKYIGWTRIPPEATNGTAEADQRRAAQDGAERERLRREEEQARAGGGLKGFAEALRAGGDS